MSRPADNYDTLAYRDDILFQRRESKSTRNQTLCTGSRLDRRSVQDTLT
jgi:hypothetical protein